MNSEIKTSAQVNAEERIHHPYSPSTLQCREACPEYDSTFSESAASKMGTMQHNVAESGDDDHRLPDYKLLAVGECMKFVGERFENYPGGQMVKEIYLPIDDEIIQVRGPEIEIIPDSLDPEHVVKTHSLIDFVGTTAGYVDVAMISADETVIEVDDFKFGLHAVEEAHNNLQGIAYLLGLKKKYPKAVRGFAFFIMPHREETTGAEFCLVTGRALRAYHSDTGWRDLPETKAGSMYLRVKAVVARAVEAHRVEPRTFSMANMTESSCLFCSNLGRCPKVAELALKIGKKYRPLEMPDSISTVVFKDPDDVSRGFKVASVMEKWAKAYRAQGSAKAIDDPNFMPEGFDIVVMAKREVKDARKLADIAKTFLPPEQQASVEKLFDLSLGPLEELISAAAARGTKEKTVDEFGEAALAAGAVERGPEFAFLRQSRKTVAKQ